MIDKYENKVNNGLYPIKINVTVNWFHTYPNFKEPLLCQLKLIYSEKATKNLRNLHLAFDHSTHSQNLGEDFTKFCGLLRTYEL